MPESTGEESKDQPGDLNVNKPAVDEKIDDDKSIRLITKLKMTKLRVDEDKAKDDESDDTASRKRPREEDEEGICECYYISVTMLCYYYS